jgi:hypothetical protein
VSAAAVTAIAQVLAPFLTEPFRRTGSLSTLDRSPLRDTLDLTPVRDTADLSPIRDTTEMT